MKNLNLLLVLPGLLAIQNVFAQNSTHLLISDKYPAAGERIEFTYDPAGTVMEGKKNLDAIVFYFDNKDYPAADIDLKPEGKLFKGEITVNAVAKAFFIKINSDDIVDNNDDKGYVYLVYKDKEPVPGAYAAEAFLLSSGIGNHFGKIKNDNDAAINLYAKEFALYPQSEKEYDRNYYYLMARSGKYKDVVARKIRVMEKSPDEKDLQFAANLLSMTKNKMGADSLNAIIKSKFPDGESVKNNMINSFFGEKDLSKKDSIYQVYIKKYPENESDKFPVSENFKTAMAIAYLKKGDIDGYHKYESQLKDKSNLSGSLNNIAWEWAVAGKNIDEAAKLSKQTVDDMAGKVNNPTASAYTSLKQAKIENQHNYDTYADTYAYILEKENKPAEALKYMQGIYDRAKSDDSYVTEHYVKVLAENGNYSKALEITEKGIRMGQNTDTLKAELKKDYIKVKGSDNGYDKYLASLVKESVVSARAELAKTMINKPAPVFTLKDFDGNTVSLSDLKGKVVIVDFWATWCGPCKASFPGMQLAVNKFRDDPNVKFLFVDTWENGDNYLEGAKKFIADNKYTFHVLMDEKGDDGRQSKVVSAFGVDGIPTKFIIDKNGNIRFKYVGYSGTPEKVLDEVTGMVDIAGNPDSVTSSQVGMNK